MASAMDKVFDDEEVSLPVEHQIIRRKLSAQLGAITKRLNALRPFLQDPLDIQVVEKEYLTLTHQIDAFHSAANSELARLDLEEEERLGLATWFENKSLGMDQSKNEIAHWINRVNNGAINPDDSASKAGPETSSVKSRCSVRSGASSSRSKASSQARIRLAEEKARLISKEALESDMAVVNEIRTEAERKAQIAQNRAEWIRISSMEKALDGLDGLGSCCSEKSRSQVVEINKVEHTRFSSPAKFKPPLAEPNQTHFQSGESASEDQASQLPKNSHPLGGLAQDEVCRAPDDGDSKASEHISLLAEIAQRSHLPKSEPEIFDGSDPTKFASFLQAFDRLIACSTSSPSDLLYYLERYTRNEPRELVQSCLYMDPKDGYREAREQLVYEYGNEFRVASAYLDKIQKWPEIKYEDGPALKRFAIFLRRCQNYLRTVSSLNQLNNPIMILGISKKLPIKLRESWRRKAFSLTKENGLVQFRDFSQFVNHQADVLCLPIFGDIRDDSFSKGGQSNQNPKRALSFATGANIEDVGPRDWEATCIFCGKSYHKLENCVAFSKEEEEFKLRFLQERRLCFGCLERDHISKNCPNRLKCVTCGFGHPTCLHRGTSSSRDHLKKGQEPEKPKDCTSACSVGQQDFDQIGAGKSVLRLCPKVALAIIPVKVRLRGSERSIVTYAGLDNFSSDCFVTNNIISQLGVDGDRTEIRLSTMNCRNKRTFTKAISNLEIMDLDENEHIYLPITFTQDCLPVTKNDVVKKEDVDRLPFLADVPFTFIEADVGLMLGANVPEAVQPLQIVNGPSKGPYASRHRLGWALNGPLSNMQESPQIQMNFTRVPFCEDIESKIQLMYENDFRDSNLDGRGPSLEDGKWEAKVEGTIRINSKGHYEIGLPFRESEVNFPNNRGQALQRALSLKRKLTRDIAYRQDYFEFMNTTINQDFAERVPSNELIAKKGQVWYIVHHGVYHKMKQKLRVVFNCSLKYLGMSLNDRLLQGPDLTNSLLGVLLRFREKKIAVMGDIEKMFYQVKVPKSDADFLRFFWFENNDLDSSLVEYRLKVHVFGAISSPSCSNFALRRAALDCMGKVADEAIKAVQECFYVDDLLKSFDDVEEAKTLLSEIKVICSRGQFNLTGITSNNRDVLSSLLEEELATDIQEINFANEDLPIERALGVTWKVQGDTFSFKIRRQDEFASSRRGLLSSIYAIYDPFGFVGSAILPAKRILQELCRRKCDWDVDIPKDLRTIWTQWSGELELLSSYEIPRWTGESGMGNPAELHVFCDGSEVGYGAVAYIRARRPNGIRSTLALAKSRLAPLKKISIPRLELAGAKLGVELASVIKREKSIPLSLIYFWTDSETVLKYLCNERKRFQRYVSNRVAFIRERSDVQQWQHVPGSENPADLASRGVSIREFVNNSAWKNGPDFLQRERASWPHTKPTGSIDENDPEIVRDQVISVSTACHQDFILNWFESISDWHNLKRMVAGFLKVKRKLLGREGDNSLGIDCVALLNEAEIVILKKIQSVDLKEVKETLEKGKELGRKCALKRLSPFLDRSGILRVGGRIRNMDGISDDRKHPIIIPKGHVANAIIRQTHVQVGHLGKETVIAKLRDRFSIVGVTTVVKRILRDCVKCRRYQGKVINQIMADLPRDRLDIDQPPFTNTGVDLFGPFSVARGRATVDRFGLVFSCLTTRAIHIEVVFDKSTDSFIQALRRFVARRGQVRTMRSDNGTNFVGAERELRDIFTGLNRDEVSEEMRRRGIDWIFNPPRGHHFGGAWEREIRTIRKVLSGLMSEQGRSFTDESLGTLFCEVESILNSKPLTPSSSDPSDLEAITPNHLLLLQPPSPTFPDGLFQKSDVYAKRRWKQVQYLADLFWNRWKKEYLVLLMNRQKWSKMKRNVAVGDMVLMVMENTPRYRWPLGRIVESYPSKDGNVRKVRVKTV